MLQPTDRKNEDVKRITILSITGGGIRGLIPLQVLEWIESSLNLPIYQVFDMIAGTSTGAIMAAGLCIADKKGRPLYSASEVTEHYLKFGKEVFVIPRWYSIYSLYGLLRPMYQTERKKKAFMEFFPKDLKMKDLQNDILLPVYCNAQKRIELISNTGEFEKAYVIDAILAATAVIALYPPYTTALTPNHSKGCYLDAGVALNNPTLLLLQSALEKYPNATIDILALGCGEGNLTFSSKSTDNGIVNLLRSQKLIDIFYTTNELRVQNELKFIESNHDRIGKLLIISEEIDPKLYVTGAADDKLLNRYIAIGQQWVKQNTEKLTEFFEL